MSVSDVDGHTYLRTYRHDEHWFNLKKKKLLSGFKTYNSFTRVLLIINIINASIDFFFVMGEEVIELISWMLNVIKVYIVSDVKIAFVKYIIYKFVWNCNIMIWQIAVCYMVTKPFIQ